MASKKNKKAPAPALSPLGRRAAGVDIGATFHVVAVPPELDDEPVRTFRSFTGDLTRLADWLVSLGMATVAMESTSVYWIPLFEILEARGLEVILVNARDAKNVPGRKTDVNDAQWLQQLHSYGLLRASFRPAADITVLRSYLRHRERLLEYAASHVQHMQKALMQMNLQLHHVVSDITGVTGLKILRAIAEGEQDPDVLAAHRDVRCKASIDTIRQALTGHYRAEHIFALRQALELYDTYHAKLKDCDVEVERVLRALPGGRAVEPLPAPRSRKIRVNEPKFDIRSVLHALLGIDLTQVDGLGPYSALRIFAECGTDMSRWPTAKHFTSWLTLAPGSKISGGKVLSSRTRRSSNRATSLLRLAAISVGKTNTALGAFFRRLAVRVGKAKAVTATARKIAVLLYNLLRYGKTYEDPGANYYEERYRQRTLHNLRKRADALGFTLVENAPTAEVSQESPEVTVDQLRQAIEPEHPDLSISRQCELLGLPRSSFYQQPRYHDDPLDLTLMHRMDKLYTQAPFYGSRRMTAVLRSEGHDVNRKRIQRLMHEMGLEAIYRKPKTSEAHPEHRKFPYLLRDLKIDHPNQVWSMDITYLPMKQGFLYLAAIIHWFSRYVMAWELSNSLEKSFCLEAVERALSLGKPEIFNTDQGVQFTSTAFTTRILQAGMQLSMDGHGRAFDNIFIERLWRSGKYEEVYLRDYQDGVDTFQHLDRYFGFYNDERPHQAPNYRTPRRDQSTTPG